MKNTRFVHDKYSSDNVIAQHIHKEFISKHYHSLLEVYYVTKGSIEVTINNQTKVLYKDQLVVCDSFEEHSYKHVSKDAKSIYITIPDSLTSKLDAWKKHKKFTNNFITNKNITKKFKTFIDLLLQHKRVSANDLYVEGLTIAILGLILQYVPLSDVDDMNKTILSNIVHYINDHFAEKLTLDGLAKHFGYSKYYFSKLFNKNFKCHFNDYVNSVRCRNVIAMLNSTPNQTILTAILNSGFSSPSSFYKFFKEYYNIPPSEIRNVKLNELERFLKDDQ